MAGPDDDKAEEIPLTLSSRERALLADVAGRGLGIAAELEALAREKDGYVLRFILEDWEELAGFLTVEASREKDAKRARDLDVLIERIEDLVDSRFDKPGDDADDGEPDE